MSRLPKLAVALLITVGLAACGGDDEPTIADQDLQATPQDIVDDEDDEDPEAAEDSDTDEGTDPAEDGEGETETEGSDDADADPADSPTFEDVCAGRDDEAFIEVLSPQADAEVDSTFTVTGCGNTFEATYLYRVEGADGEVLVEDFGTMSCGSGCVGEFEQEVSVDTTGAVTLVVFESSAQDGSEQNIVEVPLQIS